MFSAIDKKPQAKTCDAIVGITDEGAEIMKEYKGSPALRRRPARGGPGRRALRDFPLRNFEELGLNEGVRLLDQTLAEEKKADEALSKIAESAVNQEAEAA